MRMLIGSSSVQSIHAVVSSTASDKASWLTGIALIPEAPGQITLSTDADMLGSASMRLDSLSLMEVSGSAENLVEVPSDPVGERRPFQIRLSIRALEIAGALHVDLELPRLAAGDGSEASTSWEKVPSEAHILLVDTHVMGRTEMLITHLRFRYV